MNNLVIFSMIVGVMSFFATPILYSIYKNSTKNKLLALILAGLPVLNFAFIFLFVLAVWIIQLYKPLIRDLRK